MKILIILLRFNHDGFKYDPCNNTPVRNYLLPIGLSYISAVLKRAGKDVTVLNLNNRKGMVSDILRFELSVLDYDVILLGGLSLYYPHIRDIIISIRKWSPQSKVVVGGGIISAQPEIMFKLLRPDYGVIGEGEQTVLELVNFLENPDPFPFNINGLKGIVFEEWRMPENAVITIITPPREPIMDLDSLPFPDYESFGFREYIDNVKPTDYIAYDIEDEPRPYPVLASRSCPYNCTFCFHPLGKKYRQRSVDNIMKEIKENVEKYHINIISLYDELFSNDRERMIDFCEKFKAYSDTLPTPIRFWCNNRVDTTTDEMLDIMKASGAYLLSFGLESYSPTVLSSMHKHTRPDQIDRIVKSVRERGLGLQGSFIFGDVSETCDTANETLGYIRKNRKTLGAGVDSLFVVPFQGTPIYKQCVITGKIPDEIQFINDRVGEGYKHLEPMNLTDLSTPDFERLKDKVLGLHIASDTYSRPVSSRIDASGDTLVAVRCPSCGEVSVVKNVPIPKTGMRNIGCRHCYYRFHLVSWWYPLERIIVKAFGFRIIYHIHKIFLG